LLVLGTNNMSIKKTYIYIYPPSVWRTNSQIIAQHDGDASTTPPADIYFYLHDRLGSVRMLIDTDGVVQHSYTFNPFGEVLESGHGSQAPSNCFMFTGQYFDSEIDEYYLRARQYDPYIYRFTSRDPILGQFENPLTLHEYLYCINNPINIVDPYGLWGLGLRYYLENEIGVRDAYKLSDAEIEAQFDTIWKNPSRFSWHGHSDFGYRQGDFDYTRLDRQLRTHPYNPLSTHLHFKNLKDVEFSLGFILRSGDIGAFEQIMHMGQDYFSHLGRGYSWYGHLKARHEPDNPYSTDPEDPVRTFNSAFRQAQDWTKKFEDLWYLIWDMDKWLSLP